MFIEDLIEGILISALKRDLSQKKEAAVEELCPYLSILKYLQTKILSFIILHKFNIIYLLEHS